MRSVFKLISIFVLFGFMMSCAAFDRMQPSLRREVRDQNNELRSDNSAPKKRVVILPFLDSAAGRPQSLRDRARAAFIVDVNRSGELVALDSRELDVDVSKVLDIKANEYKLADMAKPAQNLGVAALLEGKILEIRIQRKTDKVGIIRSLKSVFEIVIRVRIFNVRTNKEIFNTIKTVTLEEQNVRVAERVSTDKFIEDNPEMIEILVKDAFLDFTPQIVGALDRVSWEGRIAAINGDRIYLNVGKISGINMGDLLKVTEDGDDVYDPESGGHIGRVPGRLKGTLEVISYFGNDGSISIIHSGSGFKENDRVELY